MLNINLIEIYHDGIDIPSRSLKLIKGFTTSCAQFAQSNEKNYRRFLYAVKGHVGGRPISFQIWEDDLPYARSQIDTITSMGTNVFVQIPILNGKGKFNSPLFEYAMSRSLAINIGCIHTIGQIDTAWEIFKEYNKPILVSVFAEGISDAGLEPDEIAGYAVSKFKPNSNAKILWIGCGEVITIQRAIDAGCHCISVPGPIIDKLPLIGKSLEHATIDRVSGHRRDAMLAGLSI